MRKLSSMALGLVAAWAAVSSAGCASAPEEADPSAPVEEVRAPDVAASKLARELGLRAAPPAADRLALQSPAGAQILLFPDTNVASVAGRQLELTQTLRASSGDVWISATDAATIRATWSAALGSGAGFRSPASSAYRVPIPAGPPAGTGSGRGPAPAGAVTTASYGDNRPSSAEVSAWGVPLKRKWQYLVVHHTATPAGNASTIDRAHKERGFDGLGYDFVIGNGTGSPDGTVEVGYRWKQQITGAHAKTAGNFMNEHGIGICLVGDFTRTKPTWAQMRSLDRLCTFLVQYCGISPDHLRMHGEVKSTECPGKFFPRDFAVRVPGGGARTASADTDPADVPAGTR